MKLLWILLRNAHEVAMDSTIVKKSALENSYPCVSEPNNVYEEEKVKEDDVYDGIDEVEEYGGYSVCYRRKYARMIDKNHWDVL